MTSSKPLALIAGPCVIESEAHVWFLAGKIREIVGPDFIFKASFDKANRSSGAAYRGPGLREGMRILEGLKAEGYRILTDIHEPWQADIAAQACDVLQIPAFLCRQTDLIVAAARSGRVVNVKKGQFLAPHDAKNIVDKARAAGAERIMLTERGVSFGYNNLVVDMRSFPIMRGFGVPVVYDVTHSLQLPGGLGTATGGQPEYIEPMARAGVAVGVDAVFMEIHDNPAIAPSDGPNMLPLPRFAPLLLQLRDLHALIHGRAAVAA